nr:hypothetical protein [Acidithiobacillus sp. HP-6]
MLPFSLAATEESMTAQSGLVFHGEFIQGLGVHRWLEQEMPKPGSKRGYGPTQQVLPLLLMLTGGGRSLGDLCMIHADQGLRRLLHLKALPSTDAAGAWLRRTGEGAGLAGLDAVNRRIVAWHLRRLKRWEHTSDIDATQIVAEKRDAVWTYKGERGYMPMVGHLAEAGVVIHDNFRAGNAAPVGANLDYIQACEARLPKGHRLAATRADSASYQADLFNYCEQTGKTFAIGGRGCPDPSGHRRDSRVRLDPLRGLRCGGDGAQHGTDRQSFSAHRRALSASCGSAGRSAPLPRHCQQPHGGCGGCADLVPPAGRIFRERHQGAENRLWHGAHTLLSVERQCRLLPDWGHCTQPLRALQTCGPRRRLAAPSHRHRALALVPGAGPVHSPCRCLGPEGGRPLCRRLCAHSCAWLGHPPRTDSLKTHLAAVLSLIERPRRGSAAHWCLYDACNRMKNHRTNEDSPESDVIPDQNIPRIPVPRNS